MTFYDPGSAVAKWPSRIRRTLVIGALAYVLAALMFSTTESIIATTTALIALSLLGLSLPGRVAFSDPATRFGRAVDVTATNLALTLLLCEMGLSAYGALFGSILLVRDNIDAYRFQPNHDYGRLWTNSSGYPTREFVRERRSGIARVALLGDSFAVGAVRQDMNFASQIETIRPDVEIYNFGVSAIGPQDYHLILRTEALVLDPDIVMVALFVGNDLTDGAAPAGGFELQDRAVSIAARRGWRLLREWYRRERAGQQSPVSLHSADTRLQSGFTLSRQTYLDLEVERLGISRKSLAGAHEEGWLRALSHLRAMRDECRGARVKYGIVIIPDEFQANPALRDELLTLGRVPRDDIDLRLPQRRLLDFCRTEGIACLDLLPYFANSSDLYLAQDTHWNEKGNLVAAQAIAPWLDGLIH